ncbi:hypothetical protein FRX31_022303 [Thalictrum thalictroides]|uniref:Uncharacterized protein n=1 Tax=Thalictrum thalictroides TaxID=46969 RepID=A0A7J6VVA9_THATH|nr:hypothetical protein FRX31_022303 [Thalictrum thalictroides]
MNKVLRGKWLWEEGSLWKSFVESKYGRGDNAWWLEVVRQSHGTGLWKVITEGFAFFKTGIHCIRHTFCECFYSEQDKDGRGLDEQQVKPFFLKLVWKINVPIMEYVLSRKPALLPPS